MPLLLLMEKLCFTGCSQNLKRCVACEVVLTEKQKIVMGDTGAFFDNFDDGTKSLASLF